MTASSLQAFYTRRRAAAGRRSGRAVERAVALLREWRQRSSDRAKLPMFDDGMLEDHRHHPGRGRVTQLKAILEGVMNRQTVRQPAAIGGSPPGDPGALRAAACRRLLKRAAPGGSIGPCRHPGVPDHPRGARCGGPEISSPIRLGAHAPQGEQRFCQAVVADGAGTNRRSNPTCRRKSGSPGSSGRPLSRRRRRTSG